MKFLSSEKIERMTERELLKIHRKLRRKEERAGGRPEAWEMDLWKIRREIDKKQGASSWHFITNGRFKPRFAVE